MDLLPDAAASQERLHLPILGSATELEKRNLLAFDEMDFNVFSRRDWARFHESHAQNVRVHFPDGHFTDGLEVHIKDMDAMFVYAPDTRIAMHPMRIAQDEWTAVTGVMRGTFTEPMPDGNGGLIQPTGKEFHQHGHLRPLERPRDYGRGVAVLGQPDLHATTRTRIAHGPVDGNSGPPGSEHPEISLIRAVHTHALCSRTRQRLQR